MKKQDKTVRTCLVTGGAGFIGSHLASTLVRQGHQVRVFDDFSTGKRDNLREVQDRVDIMAGNLSDAPAVSAAMKGVEWVFHLGALPSVQRSMEDPETTHAVCANGTLHVLEAAHRVKVRRVVYAASSSAYGDIAGQIRSEADPVAPISPYGVAKLAGEHYCYCFTRAFGLDTVRLRFFNVFGPRQDPSSPYSGVIAVFLKAMTEGRSPTIFGDGLQSRDFTYVDNAVEAMVQAIEAPAATGNVYNIGAGGSISLLEVVSHLNRLLRIDIQPKFATARAGDIRHSQADISRARRDLGYEPKVDFAEGLRRTLEAMRPSETTVK